jgi:DNA-binding MarR family transcriptional regulator
MLFGNLTKILNHERNHLRFVHSREDRSILVAIGQAMEAGQPIGYKQLALMEVASPSTLSRKLKQLIAAGAIRKVVQENDGRMVAYSLTKSALDSFRRYERLLRGLRW